MSIEISPLGEVVKVRYGYSFPAADFSSKGIPAIRMSDLSNYIVDTKSAARVPVEYWDKLPNYRIIKGDLIVGMSGSVGKFAIYNNKEPALQNQRVGVLKIKAPKKIDQSYLHYFAFTLEEKLLEIGKGVAVKNVSAKEIEELPIPLPPLPEQKRIAAQLAQADRLRQLRRSASQLGESYLQSAFLAMFGDPATNPKGLDLIEIGKLLSKERAGTQTGPFGSALKKHEYVDSGIPVWGINNLSKNEFIEKDSLFITKEKFQKLKKYSAEKGDILVSRAGTVGRMCVAYPIQSPSIIGTNLIRISLDFSKMHPEYFTALFTYFGNRIGSLRMSADENAYSFVNPSNLKTIKIPVPPLPEQERFAQIVARYEGLRAQMRESTRQAEMLFQGLLHESFGR